MTHKLLGSMIAVAALTLPVSAYADDDWKSRMQEREDAAKERRQERADAAKERRQDARADDRRNTRRRDARSWSDIIFGRRN